MVPQFTWIRTGRRALRSGGSPTLCGGHLEVGRNVGARAPRAASPQAMAARRGARPRGMRPAPLEFAMAMRFGVMLLQERPVAEVLHWATRFDEAGADSVWVADHLALPQDPDHAWYDGWGLLAAMASATNRCRIGPLVTTYQYHSSLAMARHVATVDALSGGRLDLGVGIGGAPLDRAFGGVADRSFAELSARLDRGLTETLALLAGTRVPVAPVPALGARTGPTDLSFTTPFPQSPRVPIVVGGSSPRSLDVAARHADRWNTYGARPGGDDAFEALRRTSGELDERCASFGRDPSEITRSVLLDFNPQLSARTAPELADLVGRLHAAGFDECIAYAWADDHLPRSVDELVSFVVDELPALR